MPFGHKSPSAESVSFWEERIFAALYERLVAPVASQQVSNVQEREGSELTVLAPAG